MPLIKSPSNKALKHNIEVEMKSNPGNPKQNLAIAYSTQRQARKKKYAKGGEVGERAGSQETTADDTSPESLAMLDDHDIMGEEEQEAAAKRPDADERESRGLKMLAKGGEAKPVHAPRAASERPNANENASVGRRMLDGHPTEHEKEAKWATGRPTVDEQRSRGKKMLDGHPTMEGKADRAASSRPYADDRASKGQSMLDQEDPEDAYTEDGIVRFARGGLVERIMDKRKKSSDEQVNLQDNENEHLNLEDQLSYDAARKDTYFDLDQLEDQPEDSNLHGRDIESDKYDRVSQIRKRMKR